MKPGSLSKLAFTLPDGWWKTITHPLLYGGLGALGGTALGGLLSSGGGPGLAEIFKNKGFLEMLMSIPSAAMSGLGTVGGAGLGASVGALGGAHLGASAAAEPYATAIRQEGMSEEAAQFAKNRAYWSALLPSLLAIPSGGTTLPLGPILAGLLSEPPPYSSRYSRAPQEGEVLENVRLVAPNLA